MKEIQEYVLCYSVSVLLSSQLLARRNKSANQFHQGVAAFYRQIRHCPQELQKRAGF